MTSRNGLRSTNNSAADLTYSPIGSLQMTKLRGAAKRSVVRESQGQIDPNPLISATTNDRERCSETIRTQKVGM
jgi:hypothetical protein